MKSVLSQNASAREAPVAVSPPQRGTKYRPLYDYLRRHPEEELVMTSVAIEIILKTLLPKSASHPGWWGIDEPNHASRSWRAAGFGAELQRSKDSVCFRRTEMIDHPRSV